VRDLTFGLAMLLAAAAVSAQDFWGHWGNLAKLGLRPTAPGTPHLTE
jgi:hypothetical protein